MFWLDGPLVRVCRDLTIVIANQPKAAITHSNLDEGKEASFLLICCNKTSELK